MHVCVFSGLCVHSDGIRHQRNISSRSWIDTGGGEDPEAHQYGNIQLYASVYARIIRRASEITALRLCVCLTEQVL